MQNEGFEDVRTTSIDNCMFELARWAQQVSRLVDDGTLKAQYASEEFQKEVRAIRPNTDFSRIAKDYAHQRRTREKEAVVSSVDSDIEVWEESTPS